MRYSPILACLLATGLVFAANPPAHVNYQGVLRDAAGNPDDGAHDMVFRFFNSSAGGSEILVDSHLAAGSGAVNATDGLFNVALGSGQTTDGSGAGSYTTLWQMFGDYSGVWMQIEIDGEVLNPRVEILSTPYAHNADQVGGLGAVQLLRSDQSDTINGSLTATGALHSGSDLYVNSDGPDQTRRIYFYDNGSRIGENIAWNDFSGRFNISDSLYIDGDLELDRAMTGYATNAFSLVADYSTDAFFGTRFEAGNLSTYIRLDPYEEMELVTEAGIEMFEVVGGTPYFLADFEHTDTRFYVEGSTAAYISNAENFSVYGSNLLIGRNGPDRDQDLEFYEDGSIEGERLQWDDSEDRFEFSDELYVFGTFGASGVKNFVQNHPEDPTLEIVYTALEGNEATTFTRGTARLEGGVAAVELEASFAMVTNPDLGLSVHLTPRGGFARLYAESVSTSELVVRSDAGDDVVFDFIVYGLRIGFEDYPVFRERMAEAPIPPSGHHDAYYAARPELRRHNPLERYRETERRVHGRAVDAMPQARALRAAIGEGRPGFDVGAGEKVARADRPDEVQEESQQEKSPVIHAEPVAIASGRIDNPPTALEPAERPALRTTAATAPVDDEVRARSFRPSARDLASLHDSAQPLEPGDVVVLSATGDGRVELSRFAAEPTVFGVVASDPGLVLGTEEETTVAVTTSGVVSCNVDASYGAIRPGDLLVTSPTPGHAMRAEEATAGTILGKAVGALDQGTGTIQIIVTLR